MSELHLYNPTCQREFDAMTSKAMCAYAEWQSFSKPEEIWTFFWDDDVLKKGAESKKQEFETFVECMAMFTKELPHEVCAYVIERAERELM